MKNNIRVLVVIGIIVLTIMGLSIANKILNKVPENDPSVIGNSAGNVNNSGLFAEANGIVYFSNSFDHGYMYKMSPDESNIERVFSFPVQNILIGGNYIYYYMDTAKTNGNGLGYVVRNKGVYQASLKGKHMKCLDKNTAVSMQLVGNYLYYQRNSATDFTQLYRVKIDTAESEQVSDIIINPASASNGNIYFNGTTDNHYLYTLNTSTNTISTVYQGNLWFPIYDNGYIYFLDVASKYKLCRLNTSNANVEVLTNDRVDTYNIKDSVIYYQKNDKEAPALIRMNIDGSNKELVAPGNYTRINLTSQYAYFQLFGESSTTYHTPLTGPINVSVFQNAMSAAAKN